MKESSPKRPSDVFMDLDIHQDKGLHSLYFQFFYIMDKKEVKIKELMEEIKRAISISSCERLELTQIDLSYVNVLTQDLQQKSKIWECKPYVHLFACLKWLYKSNRRVLESSALYIELSAVSMDSVVIESNAFTHSKLRLMLRAIDKEPAFIQDMLKKAMLLPSYQLAIVSIWGVLRNVQDETRRKHFVKTLKSIEACCVIQCLFEKFCRIDMLNDFEVSVDSDAILGMLNYLLFSLTEDWTSYTEDLSVAVVASTDYTREELENINSGLKSRYKELRAVKYQEQSAQKEIEESLLAEIETSVSEKVYTVDFGLTLQQKKDLLANSNFLLLKSDDIQIVPVMDNVRIESIKTVSPETLRNDYDAIVILTKRVWHADVFRVKSFIGDTPLIYTSRTNRPLIIEDIYNQF